AGMLVYGVAFLAWGLGAGLIYLRRRRLMPLVMAHLYTNAMFSVLPLVYVLTGACGRQPRRARAGLPRLPARARQASVRLQRAPRLGGGSLRLSGPTRDSGWRVAS